METIRKLLDELFKECEHGDAEHRHWLKNKFDDYYDKNKDLYEENIESEFVNKLIEELPRHGIDTSMWEYKYGDCCDDAIEFMARCIKGDT